MIARISPSFFPIPIESYFHSHRAFSHLYELSLTVIHLRLINISLGNVLTLNDGLSGDFAGYFFVFGFSKLEVIQLIVTVPSDREAGVFAGWISYDKHGNP